MMRLFSSDEGASYIEIVIGIGLLGVVLGAVFSALTSSQFTLERQIARSETNDEVRLAAQAIDREVRSGDLLYDPNQESYTPAGIHPGYAIRVLSQTNVPSRDEKRCVQYRVTESGNLERRDWDPKWHLSPGDPDAVHGWRIIATKVQNRPGALAPNNVPVFTQPSVNILKLDFRANARRQESGPISGNVRTVHVELSISARNSAIVADLQQCGPATPDPSAATTEGIKVPDYDAS